MIRTIEERIVGTSHYIVTLTGIRALAALLVLGFHIDPNMQSELTSIFPFFKRGYLGVDMFFILSGFIITHVYRQAFIERTPRQVGIFLWHRFVRLYPVHITILLALLIMVLTARYDGIALNHPEAWTWSRLLKQIAMLQVWSFVPGAGQDNVGWNTPSWSISAEWFAYLAFPVIAPVLLLFKKSSVLPVFAAAATLTVTFLIFKLADWPLDTIIGMPPLVRVTGEFVCGATLCCGVKNSRQPIYLTGDLLGICGFVLFFLGASTAFVSDFALVPLLALAVWGSATANGPLARFLAWAPIVWIGEVSYSAYMLHMPLIWILRRAWERMGYFGWHEGMRLFAVLVSIASIFAAAAALFYAVEWPVRTQLRDRFGRLEDLKAARNASAPLGQGKS